MKDSAKKFLKKNNRLIQVCTKCIYDEDIPEIKFDIKGICNYCHILEEIKRKNFLVLKKLKSI